MMLFLFIIEYMANVFYIFHHVFVASILITLTVKGCSDLHECTDEEKKRTKKKKHEKKGTEIVFKPSTVQVNISCAG